MFERIKNFFKRNEELNPAPIVPPQPAEPQGQHAVQDLQIIPDMVGGSPQIGESVSNPDTMSMEGQKIMRYQQDTRQRSDLSEWVKVVISLWLMAVIAIIVALGHGCLHLTESIIITLLVTTTANILGMAYLVLGDLFPKGEGALKTFMNR